MFLGEKVMPKSQMPPTLHIKVLGMELNAVGVFAIIAGLAFLTGVIVVFVPRLPFAL
jgi:hypothetical protein